MTDAARPMPRFGSGRILSETFSLFFRRFWVFFLLAFPPNLLFVGVGYALKGPAMLLGAVPLATGNESFTAYIAEAAAAMAVYGLVTALTALAAYDAKLERPVRIMAYFRAALSRIVPVAIVSMIVSFAVTLGLLALLLPGLYVASVLSAAVVTVVVERRGLSSMRRSATLTKGYRWPILGAIGLVYVLSFLITIGAAGLGFGYASTTGGTGLIVMGTLQAASAALTTGLAAVASVLIYARLRAIKEGVGVDSLVEVFD